MAVKKKATTKASGAAASKKAATRKAAPKKGATTKKAGASKSGVKAGAATRKAAAKKTPAVKLTDRQLDLLRTVHRTKDAGYLGDKRAEAKGLESLVTKKLIKRGAKDKASGHPRYLVSKAGAKHVSSSSPSA